MSIHVNFAEEDWDRIRRDWTAWWAGELERPLVIIEQLDPARPWDGAMPPPYRLPLDWAPDRVLDFYEERLPHVRHFGDAWPKWWPNYGPGIAAGFLGCRVRPAEDTVWFEPPVASVVETPAADAMEAVGPHMHFDGHNPWWVRIRELTRRAVERWGGRVAVAHTDLGGNLDILASFRTTGQLLLDVIERAGEVERLVRGITELWLRFYDELHAIISPAGRGTTPWAPIWSPGRTYMLQCDFSYMISPAMFERFVLPDLEACCAHLDHAFYHLDGKGALPHLDRLLSIPRLRGIQWIPGAGQPDADQWLDVLARIVGAGKRCQVFVTPQGAARIVEELGGKGVALAVGVGEMSQKEIRDLVAFLCRPLGPFGGRTARGEIPTKNLPGAGGKRYGG